MKKPNHTFQYVSSQSNDDGLFSPAPCLKNSPLRLSTSSFLRIEGHRNGAKVTPLPFEQDDSDHLCHHANTKPLRILIADDSDLNRKVLRRQIQSEFSGIWQNAVVKDADDGLIALEIMRADMVAGQYFDFVLLDFVMLQMHGPEAAKSMRSSLGFDGIILGIVMYSHRMVFVS